MKTVRIAIWKERTEYMTVFHWPNWWDKVCDKVNIIAYEDNTETGQVEEYAIAIAEDDVVEEMLQLDEGRGQVEVIHPDYADEMVQMLKPGRTLEHFVEKNKLCQEGITKDEDKRRPPKPLPKGGA